MQMRLLREITIGIQVRRLCSIDGFDLLSYLSIDVDMESSWDILMQTLSTVSFGGLVANRMDIFAISKAAKLPLDSDGK